MSEARPCDGCGGGGGCGTACLLEAALAEGDVPPLTFYLTSLPETSQPSTASREDSRPAFAISIPPLPTREVFAERPLLTRTRFLSIPVDESDIFSPEQALQLFRELELLSRRVRMERGLFVRTRFDSRPSREVLEAQFKAFLFKTSLANLERVSGEIDASLCGRGFEIVERTLMRSLRDLLKVACKDRDNFVEICEKFWWR